MTEASEASEASEVPKRAPLVSVLIPAFNAASTIGDALASVLIQRYPNVEIIVVNDGSTDDTARILEGYADRVTVIHQQNGGLARARNAAHEAARGEFIAWLDADDRCHPDRLAVQVGVLLSRPDVVLVSTEFHAFTTAGVVHESFSRSYYGDALATEEAVAVRYPHREPVPHVPADWLHADLPAEPVVIGAAYPHIAWGNFVHPPTVMFRRQILEAGRLDERLYCAEDWEFFVRASLRGAFAMVRAPLLEYRLSPSQMSNHQDPARAIKHLSAWFVALEKILSADPALQAADPVRAARMRAAWHNELAWAHAKHGSADRAIRHAYAAVSGGVPVTEVARGLARGFLPVPLVDGLVQLKRRLRRGD